MHLLDIFQNKKLSERTASALLAECADDDIDDQTDRGCEMCIRDRKYAQQVSAELVKPDENHDFSLLSVILAAGETDKSAVSYTHLDVYKRQAISAASNLFFMGNPSLFKFYFSQNFCTSVTSSF